MLPLQFPMITQYTKDFDCEDLYIVVNYRIILNTISSYKQANDFLKESLYNFVYHFYSYNLKIKCNIFRFQFIYLLIISIFV